MAGPIRIAILANGSQAKREIATVHRSLGGLGGGLLRGATALGFAGLTAGVIGFGKSAIDTEKKFSTSMRLVQASTHATGDEMKQLNDLAIKLGADTSFSANDAADAMLELGKAGLSTKTIMGGGVAGTLTLAAAGGTDLATAATIASNAMNTFNLEGRDMAKVAAALAGGANASSASVESLGQGLQQVGPGATNAGLSLQETVAVLSAFDAAGIKGSDAGTSLKTMLTRLVPQTDKAATAMENLGLDFTNADGSFKSITQVSQILQDRLGKLSDEQRTTALATVFGSDATRAATVLMHEGADGLREYIKASRDQAAAEEMAAARMGGTAGAAERLSGSIETAKLRLGQELAPVVIGVADGLDDKLVPAMDGTIDAAKAIGREVAPAFSEAAEALSHLLGEGDAVGHIFDDVLLPALGATADVVGTVIDFIDDLPGPVKEIGLQVGIAALVWPRFTAGVTTATGAVGGQIARLQQLRAELTYTETRTQLLTGAMSRLKAGAATAAGVGGMVALQASTQESNDGMKVLLSTLGGAGIGAAGGPWGIAIGAAGGLATGLLQLAGQTDNVENSMRPAITAAGEYASTLDELTGASRRATQAEAARALGEQNAFPLARALGISTRDLTLATIGNGDAMDRVTLAINKASGVSKTWVDSMGQIHVETGKNAQVALDLAEILGVETKALGASQRKTRDAAIASGELGRKLKDVKAHAKIVSRLDMTGKWPTGARDVAKLTRGLNLTPKKLQTVLDVLGVDVSAKRVRAIQKQLQETGRGHHNPHVGTEDREFVTKNRRILADLRALDEQQANPKTDLALDDYYRRRAELIASLNNIPDEYVNIWVTRRDGGAGGGGGGGDVPRTILGDDRVISLEGEKAGLLFGEALLRGAQRAARGGRGVAALLASVTGGSDGVAAALEKINRLIEKRTKDDKAGNARQKAILRSLDDEYDKLRRNAKAQDAINRKLEKAKQHLQEVRDWVNQVKQSFIDTGNVTQLGVLEDGTVSGDLLIDQLRGQVNDAERFAELIRQLTDGSGAQINETTLQQLLQAGPEAGLSTAEALAAGGSAAISEINELTQQLANTGQQLGSQMSNEFFDVGLQAAQGLVDGLMAEQQALDRVARRLARKLAQAVRNALGIHSPSTVFRDIGDNTIKGLTLGLDETYVRRAGVATARALVTGFSSPALQAYASVSGSSAASLAVVDIRLSADQANALSEGKRVIVKAQQAHSAGARQYAVGPVR